MITADVPGTEAAKLLNTCTYTGEFSESLQVWARRGLKRYGETAWVIPDPVTQIV